MQTVAAKTAAAHPLDPLRPEEIAAASEIVKRAKSLADSARFVYVVLKEPPKAVILSLGKSGGNGSGAPDRQALLIIRERSERKTYEAVVSLTAGEIRSWREVPNVQPAIMFEEFLTSEQVVKQDPRQRAEGISVQRGYHRRRGDHQVRPGVAEHERDPLRRVRRIHRQEGRP